MGPVDPPLAGQVFCDTGETWSEEMRQACFDYLRLGGIYAQGPISLLSGLNQRPSVLVIHFFMVALYGVSCIILPIIRAEGLRAVVAGCWRARHSGGLSDPSSPRAAANKKAA